MAIRITTWSPDTCRCVVRYQWDDSVSEDVRAHDIVEVVNQCPLHFGLNRNLLWSALTEQNPRKNKVMDQLEKRYPEQFDANHHFLGQFIYDDQGVLHIVSNPTLSASEITQAQNWCDANIGVGKVVVS